MGRGGVRLAVQLGQGSRRYPQRQRSVPATVEASPAGLQAEAGGSGDSWGGGMDPSKKSAGVRRGQRGRSPPLLAPKHSCPRP